MKIEEMLLSYSKSQKLELEREWAKVGPKFTCRDNLGQKRWNKKEKSSKSGQEKKMLVSIDLCFLTAILKA